MFKQRVKHYLQWLHSSIHSIHFHSSPSDSVRIQGPSKRPSSGPTGHHISQSSDHNRLLSSYHRDHPKSSRNLPKWNLSVVLNELTKAPFEPMKDTDLKHLTLKTAFLLALASGKHRSKIHAWVANKVFSQWEKVALFPTSDFIANNQLGRKGSRSVSPVTIPAFDYHCR